MCVRTCVCVCACVCVRVRVRACVCVLSTTKRTPIAFRHQDIVVTDNAKSFCVCVFYVSVPARRGQSAAELSGFHFQTGLSSDVDLDIRVAVQTLVLGLETMICAEALWEDVGVVGGG